MEKTLAEIKKRFEEISGGWDGETPKGEDAAMAANDILDTIKSLEEQITNYDF